MTNVERLLLLERDWCGDSDIPTAAWEALYSFLRIDLGIPVNVILGRLPYTPEE